MNQAVVLTSQKVNSVNAKNCVQYSKKDVSSLFFLEILPLICFRIMVMSYLRISYASMVLSFWSSNTNLPPFFLVFNWWIPPSYERNCKSHSKCLPTLSQAHVIEEEFYSNAMLYWQWTWGLEYQQMSLFLLFHAKVLYEKSMLDQTLVWQFLFHCKLLHLFQLV